MIENSKLTKLSDIYELLQEIDVKQSCAGFDGALHTCYEVLEALKIFDVGRGNSLMIRLNSELLGWSKNTQLDLISIGRHFDNFIQHAEAILNE